MLEEAIRFGDRQQLIGVLTAPDQPIESAPAVLFFNAGLIHHVGPSRLYVRLARRLTALGFVTLRFDFSGIGDSGARTDALAIDQAFFDDMRQAMDYLKTHLNVSQFILTGHCSGAWMAFLAAGEDERIVGSVLMNPEGGEEDWVEYDRQRKTSRFYENYYEDAISDPEKWKKLLTGKAHYRNIANTVFKTVIMNRVSALSFKLRQRVNPPAAAEVVSPLQRWPNVTNAFLNRPVQLLLLFSEGSSALDHAHAVIGKELNQMLESGIAKEMTISNADHMFTLMAGQQTLMLKIEEWCRSFLPSSVREAARSS
jgi:dienelactone hydrolase